MLKVFISYSRRDWFVAEGLAENLGSLGYDVWIDTGIKPNTPYAEEITSALDNSDVAIVIWSKDAIVSDWVRWEAKRALSASKLLQLRTPDVDVVQIPAPFEDYTIYHEGGIAEVDRRIKELLASEHATDQLPIPKTFDDDAAPPEPEWSSRDVDIGGSRPAANGLLYSFFAISLGFLISMTEAPTYVSSLLMSFGCIVLLATCLYLVFFSVSRFSDRFGQKAILEAILFGVVASLFAGIIGGYSYAADYGSILPNVSKTDLFITKYIRVIVIVTIAGTLLSYLLLALVRYLNLRRRNLGPEWSRRNSTLQIALPVIFVVILTLATSQLADRLPNVGYLISQMTYGKVDWIGSGQCQSLKFCTNIATTTYCRNCTVGDMTGVHISLVLSIFLWSQHVFHMRQVGASLGRILLSSLPIVAAAIGLVVFFHISPTAAGSTEDIQSWKVLVLMLPWLILIFWTIFAIARGAASVVRRPIIDQNYR